MDPAQRLVSELVSQISDQRVLAALAATPRERFVRPEDVARAYENVALPIASEQTISQPLVVARMAELLELTEHDRVLDVGTGSGYHAAVLSRLCAHVWTIERHEGLARAAAARLASLGLGNITCVSGDGRLGVPEAAPFDAINIAAAIGDRRTPAALEAQLALGGRLVAPLGRRRQYLARVRRDGVGFHSERLEPVRFVPLVPGQEP